MFNLKVWKYEIIAENKQQCYDFYNFVFPKFLVAIFRQSDPLQTNVLSLKIRIIELLFFEINIFAKL